ncbi:peptide-binding protein [Aliiroseovarius sp. KMU-50]|uniref:Peptide-binding protein n=1 Tax=Aliiroseovarius salicola TaxID=3009082 RepID=A0ABT4VXP9_9RHOB|nr:peptide-binding protein [Aliiroseovarius sp. KMU-50]MDA5093030.1 peptide-binding protein [Aliiroseovarius sp. KMU-50]
MPDSYPALYDVSNVASDDVLNVREHPTTGAEILGAFPPDRTGIEIVSISSDLTWGMVNIDERAGWVSLRYLARQPGQDWGMMPWPLDCYGTEPFWDLHGSGEDTLVLERMDEGEQHFRLSMTTMTSGRPDRYWMRGEDGPRETLMNLRREECHDGMSDRGYGLSVDILLDTVDGQEALSGCCSITPR